MTRVRGAGGGFGQQPVATPDLLAADIAHQIEGDPLAGLPSLRRTVLRVQAAHPHRHVGTGQEQRVVYRYPSSEGGARHHEPGSAQ